MIKLKAFYNYKIVQYKNEIEISVYNQSIGIKTNKGDKKKRKKLDKREEGASSLKEIEEREKKDKEERKKHTMQSTISRTKKHLYYKSRMIDWEYFVTLTLDKKKVDRFDYEVVSKIVSKWLNNMRTRYAPNLVYLIVPDLHEDGAYHFHGLLKNTGALTFSKSNIDKIYNIDQYPLGFTTVSEVENIRRVSGYIIKYITKDMIRCVPAGKKRYWASRNIPAPAITYLYLDQSQINKKISNFKEKIAYHKKVDINNQNYANIIDYYHLQKD